jgi:hypothetical protein
MLSFNALSVRKNPINVVKSNSCAYGKLSIIIDQIKVLQKMGNILIQCELNDKLHKAFVNSKNVSLLHKGRLCSMLSHSYWK